MKQNKSGPLLTVPRPIERVQGERVPLERSSRTPPHQSHISPPLHEVAPATRAGKTQRRSWGTLAYFVVAVLPVVAYMCLGRSQYLYPEVYTPWSIGISGAQFVVFVYQIILCTLCYTGILCFGAPADRRPGSDWRWNSGVKLIVAYVSRGNQPATLNRASSESRAILDALEINYELEVVTDIEIPPSHKLDFTGGDIHYYVVPSDYETPTGARYKARALQYLLEQRNDRLEGREDLDNVWVLHMDEESIVTPECIAGIAEHIKKYDLRSTPGAIGQGEILYNSYHYGDNVFVTATDSVRTAQDLGLFRLSFKSHLPLIGMHGSYVLTPASVEQKITWDVGGHGSVTEDAYFALTAFQRGVKFDWVPGFIREQSPFNLMDIIRQRRRWFCGLWLVAFDHKLNFKTTLLLKLAVIFWAVAAFSIPLPYIYLYNLAYYETSLIPRWLYLFGVCVWGIYGGQYSIGTYRNLLHSGLSWPRKLRVAASSVLVWALGIPALTESIAVLYGIFVPVKTFYVVTKDSDESFK